MTLTPLPPGDHRLHGARPPVDLAAAGWTEREWVATGTATSPAGASAPYAVRVLVRAPAAGARTLAAEWLNVSSGAEAAPDWTYLAAELMRSGTAWAGISAQYVGVMGGQASVSVGDQGSPGLRGADPGRYGASTHPGDAWCHDVYAQVARAVAEDLGVDLVLAVGESQSACMLARHLTSFQDALFGGYLVHSRAGSLPPLQPDGSQHTMAAVLAEPPATLPDDVVPTIVVQTETDVLGRMRSWPARQPDGLLLRTWEVAGTAHADKFQIDAFEDLLGCPTPVNRGQQVFVLRAALRHLEAWARGGAAPPSAPPLAVEDGAYVFDELGNVLGGVRTPAVEAPVERLSGFAPDGATLLCQLFGSTTPLAPEQLRARWASQAEYRAAYDAATDAMISAGFAVEQDRQEIMSECRPSLLTVP